MKDLVTYLILFLLIIGIFIVIRSIALWYWRITEIVNNQIQQIQLLKNQNDLLQKVLNNSLKQTENQK